MDTTSNDPLLAIGAVGGSGTRVLADIMIQLGIFMGNDLNDTADNCHFTRLFSYSKWYTSADTTSIQMRFAIFKKIMPNATLSLDEKIYYYKASLTNTFARRILGIRPIIFPKTKLKSVDNYNFWGWKEPNTQYNSSSFFFPDRQICLRYSKRDRYGIQ